MTTAPLLPGANSRPRARQYFFAVCTEGSQPDNRYWAERKRRSVVRFGKSTASLRLKWPDGVIPAHYGVDQGDVSEVLYRWI